jgi:hypothetical protein
MRGVPIGLENWTKAYRADLSDDVVDEALAKSEALAPTG